MGIFGVTTNRAVKQIMELAKSNELDTSTMIAIQNINNQLNALRKQITLLQTTINSTATDNNTEVLSGIRQTIVSMINKSGTKLYHGDVLVRGDGDNWCTTTDIENDENVIGVAFGDGEMVMLSATNWTFHSAAAEIGSAVAVCQNGTTRVRARALSSVSIQYGDFLAASNVARYAKRAIAGEPGIFGVALEQLASGTEGDILAFVNPYIGYKNQPEEQSHVMVPTYDIDGTKTGFSGYISDVNYYRDDTLSTLMRTEHFNYNASGLIQSAIISCYDVDGTATHGITLVANYISGELEKIIQELQG